MRKRCTPETLNRLTIRAKAQTWKRSSIAIAAICLFSVYAPGCSDSGSGNQVTKKGGTASGGVKSGGNTMSGGNTTTGGSPNTGGSVTTGGTTNSGGAPTVTGGKQSGGAIGGSTSGTGGGTSTGGSNPATGGTQNGGANSGGSGSGGATTSNGGTISGGASSGGTTGSGGVQTGGASSGGAVSTGGSSGGGGVTIPEAPTPKSGDLWVSPNGSDSNSGAKESPLKSLATAIPKLTPGQTIWMTEGTHLFTTTVIFPRSMKGTASQMYRVAGDPSGARPVLDFMGVNRSSEIRALQIDGDFWHLRNLEVQNPSDNGINVAGSNNILELLAVHDCGDTGVQISGTNSLLPSHNQVINCDSYMNADNSAENADGFAAKLDIGPGNVFYGCRSWYNVDDGWDHFEAGKNPVILENCWSFGAKHPTKSKPNSDGNGFKMGGQRREIGWYDVLPADSPIKVQFPTYEQYKTAYTAAHRLSNCFAFNNPSTGFDRNNNPSEDITCTNCGAWGNKENVSPGLKMVGELINLPSVTVEKAIAAKRDAKGNLPDIRTLQ